MGLLDSFLQGASNSAASTLSVPVDVLAWALRKAGLPIPSNHVGGSDWMAQQGLTREPENRNIGLLGEAIGGVAPMVAAAKAPQIAKGLLQMEANAMAPTTLNPQAGMIKIPGRGQIPENASDVKRLSDRLGKLLDQANVEYSYDKSQLSPARYFMLDNPSYPGEMMKIRISDHRNVHGADISVDPHTGGTFEEMIDSVRNLGVPISNRVKPDLSVGEKVSKVLNSALGFDKNSLISSAVRKYGPINSESFKNSPFKNAEQRLYQIYNLPKHEYQIDHLNEVNSILDQFK